MGKKKAGRSKHIPQRTCMVCRRKMDKRQLTRIVRTPDGDVMVDPTGKKNGRGAYVCDQSSCWDKVLNSQILDKALKTAVSESDREALAAHRPSHHAPT